MLLNRREFLKAAAAAAAAGIIVPAWVPPREAYVTPGEHVDWVDNRRDPRARLMFDRCGASIMEVRTWDGVGYPVKMYASRWNGGDFLEAYDFQVANMLTAYPKNIWHSAENFERYPNVHCYIRMHRFGETAAQALRTLNFRPEAFAKWLA